MYIYVYKDHMLELHKISQFLSNLWIERNLHLR